MNLNLNETALVKLTPIGVKILEERHLELLKSNPNYSTPFLLPNTNGDGYSKWQLWQLMSTFGEHIGMAKELPFETEVVIENKW
tara:strand:- start:2926 stop:3177 length:252 start_codon:yes stop_codon:yes gene_type:complete